MTFTINMDLLNQVREDTGTTVDPITEQIDYTAPTEDVTVDLFADTTLSSTPITDSLFDTTSSNDPWASVTQIGTNIESVDPTVMDNYDWTYNTGLTGFAQSELDAAKASGDKGLISLAEQLYGAAQAEDALTKTYGTETGILTPDAFSPEYQQAAQNYNDYKYMLAVADRYSGIHNSPIFNAALTAATGGAWGVARGLFSTIDAAANGNWEDALKSGALTYVSSQLIDSNAALDAAKATGDAAAINAAQQQLSDAYNLSLATTGASALAEGDYRQAAVAGLQALGMTGDISAKLNEYGVTNETLNKIVTSGVSAAAAGDDPLMAMGTVAASEGFNWLADNVFKSDQPAPVEDKSTQAESTVEINPATGLPYDSPVSSQTGQGDGSGLYTDLPQETVGVTSTVDNNVVNVTATFGDTKVELNYPESENYWDNAAYVYDNKTGEKTGWLVKEDGTVVPDPTTGLKLDLDKETGLVINSERNALILEKAALIEQAMAGQEVDPSLWDSLFGQEYGIDYYGGEMFDMPTQDIYINFDPTTVTPVETTQPTEVVQQPPEITQDTTGGGGGGSEGGMLTGTTGQPSTSDSTAATVDVTQTPEYKAIEQEVQAVTDSKIQLESELATTQLALNAAQQEYDDLLDKTSDEAKSLQEDIDALELGKESIQEELDAANASIKELEGKLATAESTITTQEGTISDQKTTIGNLETELSTTKDTLATTQETLSTTKDQLATAQSDKEALQKEYDALADKSSQEATDLKGQIDAKDSEIKELNGTVETLQGKVDTANSTIKDLEGKLTTAQGTIDTQEGTIADLNTQLTSSKDSVTKLEGELKDAQTNYNTLESSYNTSQENLTAKQGELDATKEELAAAKDAYSKLESTSTEEAQALRDTIGELNGTVASLEQQVKDAQAETTAKQGELDAANEALTAKQGELDTANESIKTLEGSLAAEQEKVTTLEGKLQVAKEDYAALEQAGKDAVAAAKADGEAAVKSTQEAADAKLEETVATLEGEHKDALAAAEKAKEDAVAQATKEGEEAVAAAEKAGADAVAAAEKAMEEAVAAAQKEGVDAVEAATKAGLEALAAAKDQAAADAKAAKEAADKAVEDAKAAGEKAVEDANAAHEKAIADAKAEADAAVTKAIADGQAAVDKAVADGKAAAEAAKAEGYATGYGEGETAGYGTGYGEGYGEGKGVGYASGMLAGRGAGRGGRAFSPYSGELDTQLSRVAYAQPQQAIDYVDQLLARLRA